VLNLQVRGGYIFDSLNMLALPFERGSSNYTDEIAPSHFCHKANIGLCSAVHSNVLLLAKERLRLCIWRYVQGKRFLTNDGKGFSAEAHIWLPDQGWCQITVLESTYFTLKVFCRLAPVYIGTVHKTLCVKVALHFQVKD